MDETLDLAAVHEALVRQWGLWPLDPGRLARESLLDELGRRIGFLLRHDLDRLMSSMYILDVPEEKFADAIRRPPAEHPERILAEVILDRELEKMQSRKRYARHGQTAISAKIEESRPSE